MTIIVTGNIGCGKSTFTKMLMQHLPNYDLIDVDALVHSLYDKPHVQGILCSTFGTADRKEISDLVFSDPKLLQKLEDITKEFVVREMKRYGDTSCMVIDFPLYFELGVSLINDTSRVITVHCTEDTQRARIAARGRFTTEKTDVIIGNQYSSMMKQLLATDTVDSECTLEELEKKARSIAMQIKIDALEARFMYTINREDMWDNIKGAYSDPGRHYHAMSHLVHLFEEYDKVSHLIRNRPAVELAIWYHDFYYDTDERYATNEYRSAAKLWQDAREYLRHPEWFAPAAGGRAAQVQFAAEMIIATKGHKITSPYLLAHPQLLEEAKMFLDMDLSGFAAPLEDALRVSDDIRKEFGQYDEYNFAIGRAKALKQFLDTDQLFQSKAFFHLEPKARENIQAMIHLSMETANQYGHVPVDFNKLMDDAFGTPEQRKTRNK